MRLSVRPKRYVALSDANFLIIITLVDVTRVVIVEVVVGRHFRRVCGCDIVHLRFRPKRIV